MVEEGTCNSSTNNNWASARMWICEACERAPAAFLCKADNASLCASCDADIHSANPLASRHHRVPIGPLYGPPTAQLGPENGSCFEMEEEEDDEDEAASWLLLNNNNNQNNNEEEESNNNNGFMYGDEYLDLGDDGNNNNNNNNNKQFVVDGSDDHQHQYGVVGDSVVPFEQGGHQFHLGLEFEPSKPAFNYNNASMSQSVSVSSMDVGVVPESAISNVSISHSRPPKGTIDLFSGPPMMAMPSHLAPLDREARVLRYREKKKNRKFEKTIRYASRKAYAETRPRIKGRFAKRTTDAESEVDQMFSTTMITEVGYGIVPSF